MSFIGQIIVATLSELVETKWNEVIDWWQCIMLLFNWCENVYKVVKEIRHTLLLLLHISTIPHVSVPPVPPLHSKATPLEISPSPPRQT